MRLSGALDLAGTSRLSAALDRAFIGARLIVIDLRGLQFIDSAGLQAIVCGESRARCGGRRLVFIRGSAQIDRLLEATGLSQRSDIIDLRPIRINAADQTA